MKSITIHGCFDPIATYEKLQDKSLLGEFSFIYENKEIFCIGFRPRCEIRLQNDQWILKRRDAPLEEIPSKSPFCELRHIVKKLGNEWSLFGYISFDVSKYCYNYANTSNLPLIEFIQPGVQILFYSDRCQIMSNNPECYANYLVTASREPQESVDIIECDLSDVKDKEKFIEKVCRSQKLIAQDIAKKIIISRTKHYELHLRPSELYSHYRHLNKSSSNFLLEYSGRKIIGCSPEVLLSSDSERVSTNLLAGTRPRDIDPMRDQYLRSELLSDEKEVYEHALSVLAAYGEMKIFCLPEKVHVDRFMEIKEYSGVRHIFSRLTGVYQEGKDMFDALQTLFPAITVSGVPKDVAIKHIREIENTSRALYAGVVGYLDSDERCEFPIAIRCIFSEEKNHYYIQAGAGIMRASNPLNEFN